MSKKANLQSLSDDELLRRVSELLGQSRRTEADLVAHIAEVEARRLYAREAVPSMFAWCTEVLHLSDYEAYLRITVARAARKHPILLTMLRDGRLHLSGIAKLAPHLTAANRETLLKRATHKTKRQLEELIAELSPRPEAPSAIRKLPARRAETPPSPAGGLGLDRVESSSPAPQLATAPPQLGPDRVAASQASSKGRPAALEPLAPTRYRVQFTASIELRDKLERLQALMRSTVPDGDLAKIIDVAVTEKLERLEAKRFAKTKSPRKGLAETPTAPSSRHIPAAVRRAVHERDGGRCTYRDKHARRCTKRHDLEFHHRRPFGRDGDHSPGNLALMCKAHNGLQAERDYGKEKMARYRRPRPSGGRVSEPRALYAGGNQIARARLPPPP